MENRRPVIWVYHTETRRGPTKHQSAARVSLSVGALLPYLLACRITFTRPFQERGGSCETQSSHAPSASTSIGADTWQTLRRFHVWANIDMQLPPAVLGRSPKRLSVTLPAPHRCSGWFLRCNWCRFSSVALLCAAGGWTPPNGFTGVFIWDQIAICLELWSLCKPNHLDADSVEVLAVCEQLIHMFCRCLSV